MKIIKIFFNWFRPDNSEYIDGIIIVIIITLIIFGIFFS